MKTSILTLAFAVLVTSISARSVFADEDAKKAGGIVRGIRKAFGGVFGAKPKPNNPRTTRSSPENHGAMWHTMG